MTVLLAVWGASPGMGKSTLSEALSAWLKDAGVSVDHFREEEILTRPQFAAVAEEFTATGAVAPGTLLTATARFVDAVLASGDEAVVADALMPYVPTLLAMGQEEQQLDAFMNDLGRLLEPLESVLVFLDGDPTAALTRAAEREGPGWLDWYIDKLAGYEVRPPVRDLESAVGYLRRERATTLRAARRAPWRLVLVDHATERTRAEVLHDVQQQIRALIPALANEPSAPDGCARFG